MADDWKVGDLALCVRGGGGKLRNAFKLSGKGYSEAHKGCVTEGAVYTVRAVRPTDGGLGLGLKEIDGPWCASRFRKIRPDEHEDCEPEFVELLNRIKRRQDA